MSMFGGYNLMVDRHWPREHVGHEVYPYRGHPFWQWLRRTVGIGYGLTMERGRRIMRDRDMIVLGREIVCSPRQFDQLKRAIAAQK